MTPEVGKIYIVKHSSGYIRARFVGESLSQSYHGPHRLGRTITHYRFENLSSGREIVLKSRVKIKREATEDTTSRVRDLSAREVKAHPGPGSCE